MPTVANKPTRPRRVLLRAALLVLLACSLVTMVFWLARPGRPPTDEPASPPQAARPGVLWAYKSQESFVASPVPAAEAVYVSGIGAFNTGVFHALAPEADATNRVLWSKVAPFVKRPTVSAAKAAEGLVIFGDGMHQTNDAVLYCLQADGGLPLWQLPVPGKLVHLEGSPAIEGGRVFIGAGEAGVLCVDPKRVTLDGKEQDLPGVRALIEKRWTELMAKYAQDKEKDPDFAVPPSEDALPKPAPKLLWQQGKGTWHVDAPVAASGGRVLAASAYLDEEKIGKRSLLCLNAADGKLLWERPLKINPWAGPTVAGEIVLVGCSSIRFDTKKIPQAAGEVVAVDLADGSVKWRKDVPGGVLSRIVAADGLAVFTATDGKVRAWEAVSGEEKWVYSGPDAFFAGPAVTGGVVYAADLKAVLHGIRLADGKGQWTLDVAADPAVLAPGMVYGSPVVHGERIYLATCNLEGTAAGGPSAVVCISQTPAAPPAERAPGFAVDEATRTLTIPCRIAPRKLPNLKEIYPIEVVASYPSPRGQKAHETVVTIEARCSDVHKALEGLGLKPGRPARGEAGVASGPELRIFLELAGVDGRPRLVPIEKTLIDGPTGRPLPHLKWHFTGSAMRQPDPGKDYKVYGADLGGTLITVFPVTDDTVFQSNLSLTEERLLKLETNKDLLGAEGTAVKLIIRPADGPETPDATADAAPAFAPVPLPGAPQEPWRSDRLIPVPVRSWLPPAEVYRGSELLPSEAKRPAGLRPTADEPPLAPPSSLLPVSRPPLPAGPLARAASPDVAGLPADSLTGSSPGEADPAGDATLDPSRQTVLATAAGLRQGPAPFLRLTIPDPFEAITAVQLRRPPPDDDAPVAASDLPARAPLPTSR